LPALKPRSVSLQLSTTYITGQVQSFGQSFVGTGLTKMEALVLSLLGVVLLFFLFVFLYMPIVGVAPSSIVSCQARLLRCIKNKKPGAKPFTYDEILPNVYLGALPHNSEEVRSLVTKHNVGGFVTMNCSWELPGKGKTTTVKEIEHENIIVCHLPTPDFSPVLYKDLCTGADFVQQVAEKQDKGCYVHCNAGKGRSTMVVLAYMIKYKQMTAMDALRHVESKRNIANFLCCCKIRPQWRGVCHFEKKVRGGGKANRVAPNVSPAVTKKSASGGEVGVVERVA